MYNVAARRLSRHMVLCDLVIELGQTQLVMTTSPVKLRLLMCVCGCGVPVGRCAEKACTVCTDAVLIYPVRL